MTTVCYRHTLSLSHVGTEETFQNYWLLGVGAKIFHPGLLLMRIVLRVQSIGKL